MMKIDVKIQNRVIEHFSFEKGTISIGRDPGCDLKIDNPVLSRKHAQITSENGQHFIEDLGSTNGVFLRDQKIAGKTPLKDGDEFKIDKFTFHVKLGEAAPDAGKKKDFAFDIMGTMQIDASKMQERLKKDAAAAAAPAAPVHAAPHAAPAPAKGSGAQLWIGIAVGLVAGFIAGWLARGGAG